MRAPLSGSIIEINRDLESHPELLKQDPYGAGWLFRLEIEAGEEIEHLLIPPHIVSNFGPPRQWISKFPSF